MFLQNGKQCDCGHSHEMLLVGEPPKTLPTSGQVGAVDKVDIFQVKY